MSNDMKDQMTEVKGQIDENKAAEQLGQPRLVPLARNYLAQSIDAVCRIPSPNLKNTEFRATLLHWRAVMLQSIAATKTHASAFTVAIQAIASSEGALQAKRLIDNVMGQSLWSATVDISRARARADQTAGDVELAMRERLGAYANEELRSDADPFPMGLDPARDPDNVEPPSEEEAIEALENVNAWLSMIADLLPADDAERQFLGLEDGLPYTQRKDTSDIDGETVYVAVHDINEALEIQLEKNKASFAARTAKRIAAQKDTFAAIARLAA